MNFIFRVHRNNLYILNTRNHFNNILRNSRGFTKKEVADTSAPKKLILLKKTNTNSASKESKLNVKDTLSSVSNVSKVSKVLSMSNASKLSKGAKAEPTTTIETNNDIIAGYDYKLYLEIMSNEKSFYSLFKLSNCKILMNHYKELSADLKNKILTSKYTAIMYIKFIQTFKISQNEFFDWFDTNKTEIDKKYGMKLLNYIIDYTRIEDYSLADLVTIGELYVSHYHSINIKLMKVLEAKLIENPYDVSPINLASIVRIFSIMEYKANDEKFCELVAKLVLCNLTKFNYNSLVIFLYDICKFNKIPLYMYKFVEEYTITKFKNLYKTKTIERISEAFITLNKKFPGEFNNIISICHDYLCNNKAALLQLGEIKSLSLMQLDDLSDDSQYLMGAISNLKSKNIQSRGDLVSYATFYKAYLKFNNNAHELALIQKINNSFIDILKENSSDYYLVQIMNYFIQIDFLKFIKFENITDKLFYNFEIILNGFSFNDISILHHISLQDKRVLNILTNLMKKVRKEPELHFLTILKYLNNFKESHDSLFYKNMLFHFEEILIENSLYNFHKLKVSTLPICSKILSSEAIKGFIESNKTNIVEYLENEISNTSEYVIFSLIVLKEMNLERKTPNQQIIVDLWVEKNSSFFDIKELLGMSLDEMNAIYNEYLPELNIKFNNSLYVY